MERPQGEGVRTIFSASTNILYVNNLNEIATYNFPIYTFVNLEFSSITFTETQTTKNETIPDGSWDLFDTSNISNSGDNLDIRINYTTI